MPFRRPRYRLLAIAEILCGLLAASAWAEIEELGEVKFSGEIRHGDNLSAAAQFGDSFLLVGSDEIDKGQTNVIQVLQKTDAGYRVKPPAIEIGGDKEMDIEAIAVHHETVYVIGSHSLVRKKVDADSSYRKNRSRLEDAPERDREFEVRNSLVRLELKPDGTRRANSLRRFGLREILDEMSPFNLFRHLPSKENGVDIEGLAFRGGKLYAGFRGPVLRGNYVPVLEFGLAQSIESPRVLYVDLCGSGIRDLAALTDGFLILAGPIGDSDAPYTLYRWDGRDTVPGKNHLDGPGVLETLGDLPGVVENGTAGKAEGLAVLREGDALEVLVVFDGLKDGGARRYRVPRHGDRPRCKAE